MIASIDDTQSVMIFNILHCNVASSSNVDSAGEFVYAPANVGQLIIGAGGVAKSGQLIIGAGGVAKSVVTTGVARAAKDSYRDVQPWHPENASPN